MAVPQVTNIYPATGTPGGGALVRILGQNFREPPEPPASGIVPEPEPTVEVRFGGVASARVMVANSSLLYARVPISPLSASTSGNGAGQVNVQILNLDDDGDPIVGETVTVTDGFEYLQTELPVDHDFTRLTEQVVIELRRQVIDEVVIGQDVDYDDETGDELNRIRLARLPALTLIGPATAENRFYSINAAVVVEDGDSFVRQRPPYTINVEYQLLGVANNRRQLLNLAAAVLNFFQRNKWLYLARTAGGSDTVQYEMEMIDDPSVTAAPNASNVASFSARFEIRGFDIESHASFSASPAQDMALDRVTTLESDVSLEPQRFDPA